MRIILFTGKGGVGKTSVASATGLALARAGKRVMVMSLDPAHSLSDCFDRHAESLVDHARGAPVQVEQGLWIQEVDVLEEVHRHWHEVHDYISTLLNISGMDEVLADELAIIPGMEEASCLLYINQYVRENAYDVLILDCAPTGESLRFVALPSILRWYIKKLYKLDRSIAKVARPILRHVTDVPLPGDAYFDNLKALFDKLEGVDQILADPDRTTVRLVTNPEKMVINETQRAYLYFNLYGLQVDAIVINRVLPLEIDHPFFTQWRKTQERSLEEIDDRFSPVPMLRLNLQPDQVVGTRGLELIAREVYGDSDPAKVFFRSRPLAFRRRGKTYSVTLRVPFLVTEDVQVTRLDDELVIRIAGFRRYVPLPRTVPPSYVVDARLDGDTLRISFTPPGA